ncbi:hypothetical protein [Streptomyces sp. NPDC060077]|uniref:hypothetical protein n=1 Tax=Streptomyces sp. NPDC060077 TaxID=3347052 RepID=UPI00365E3402
MSLGPFVGGVGVRTGNGASGTRSWTVDHPISLNRGGRHGRAGYCNPVNDGA